MTMNVADSKKCIKCSNENKSISLTTVISTKNVRKIDSDMYSYYTCKQEYKNDNSKNNTLPLQPIKGSQYSSLQSH